MYLILKNTVTLGQYNGGVFCKQQMNISFPKKIVGLKPNKEIALSSQIELKPQVTQAWW